MDKVELGNTGLMASVAGLGAGGFSRLGLSDGATVDQAADVVRVALDEGVNLIDTAAAYGTEEAVGRAISGRPRDEIIVSTKVTIAEGTKPREVSSLLESLDNSLATLGIDCIDIFHLHAVKPMHYEFALHDVWPAFEKERDKGKFRFIGITETSPNDLDHKMLADALASECPWRVMMLAHNMMHQSAGKDIYPHTLAQSIGTLVMFAVRRIFARPDMLRVEIAKRVAMGELAAEDVDLANPVGFLLDNAGASSITEAAYRFCRHEPGADVVLFGTGNPDHVKDNVRALAMPALPDSDVERIRRVFGSLVGVGIELPPRS